MYKYNKRKMEIFLEIEPKAFSNPYDYNPHSKDKRSVVHKRPKYESYVNDLKYLAMSEKNKKRGLQRFLSAPIYAQVSYRFKVPKYLQKNFDSSSKLYKITTPDLTDNLNKPVFDALKGLFFQDDNAISKFSAEKIYSLEPGIHIVLKEM